MEPRGRSGTDAQSHAPTWTRLCREINTKAGQTVRQQETGSEHQTTIEWFGRHALNEKQLNQKPTAACVHPPGNEPTSRHSP